MRCRPSFANDPRGPGARQMRSGRQVVGQRDFLRRSAVAGLVPGVPCERVARIMFAGSADRDELELFGPAVDQLPTHTRADAYRLSGTEDVLGFFDEDGQFSGEHQVDLFLAPMGMDAPSLTRPEDHEAQPERDKTELAAQGLSTVLGRVVEFGETDVRFGHGETITRCPASDLSINREAY